MLRPCYVVWFAHALVDRAGVHVVWGHSSHHVKATEVYKGRAVQVDSMKPMLKVSGTKRLKLEYDKLRLSSFASTFNLRRCTRAPWCCTAPGTSSTTTR
jgi:hypothetical protein